MTRKRSFTILACAVVAVSAMLACYALAQPRDPAPADRRPVRPDVLQTGDRPVLRDVPGAARPVERRRPGPEAISQFAGAVGHLTGFCFDSKAVGVMAVGAMRDEVRQKPAELTKELEGLLGKVRTQGLRNAIRLTLKDVYRHQGDDEKVAEQLQALIAENDKALQAEKR